MTDMNAPRWLDMQERRETGQDKQEDRKRKFPKIVRKRICHFLECSLANEKMQKTARYVQSQGG